MYSGYFPAQLKIAKVIPLYKKGDTNCLDNYRPISLLPLFSKIFEKLIYSRLTTFFDNQGIINTNQYGFRKNHSTTHALHAAVTRISKAINSKQYSFGVFIDFSKAFDLLILSNIIFYFINLNTTEFGVNHLNCYLATHLNENNTAKFRLLLLKL